MDKQDRDLLIRMDEKVTQIYLCVKKQNNRISSLEKFKWIQLGAYTLLAALFGAWRFGLWG